MLADVPTFISTIFPAGGAFTTDQYFSYKPFTKLDPNNPQYYAICATNAHHRKNENFASLNILVCDDVGTKAVPPPLPPTYIIETSPNNYQYGFLLSQPETDRRRAKTLVDALVKSGYSDPGAHGIVRLVRLPAGLNIKQNPGFPVTLTHWSPTTAYDYDTLLNTFKKTNNKTDYIPPDDIHEGERNSGLTQLFGHLLSTLPELVAVRKLYAYNEQHTHPPLSTSELETIITSITSREGHKNHEYINNIYHIISTNTWYDFDGHVEATKDSIDIKYAKIFSGKDTPSITKWLKMQTGFNEVNDTTWYPVPHGHEQRTVIVEGSPLLNTWRGFALKPQSGPVQPWLTHLEHLIPEPDYQRALLWWIAFTIQKPHLKSSWHPIILGASGAGKDALFRPVATILGRSFKSIGNKDIRGDFDDGLYQTKLLHISEAHGLRGAAIEFYKRITAIESSTSQMLNIKCKGKVHQQNICNVLVITNNLDAMRFTRDERRALVLRAPSVMTGEQQTDYFDDWLDKNGAAYLFDYLLNYDLSEYKPGILPYKTCHFDNLFDMTRNDAELELEEFLKPYQIALPDGLAKIIPSDNKFSISFICTTLENTGWIRWDHNRPNSKIRKVVDGKQLSKSRGWYVRKNSIFYNSTGADMYDEVERVETILNSIIGKNHKY